MNRLPIRLRNSASIVFLSAVLASPMLTGCTAITLVDAAASTAVGVTKATVGVTKVAVKGTAAAVGAVIPDNDDEKKSKK